ncbi:heparinase II/III family protein [Martelella endophytica]|uniref:Heparinase n=1 Tax=Martelella endophytica TaxID=1486262 RepID=A0A0D5LVL8_MAREN|nr:heparinase II/III-family protein [Martelella endophytica]AJY48000.1 heparinase [Martelella endophytica]
MFRERLKALPAALGDFTPPWRDRERWTSLPADFAARLTRGVQECPATWPVMTASDYLAFTKRGDRVGFEALYMQRRRMLNALALGECVEGNGRYITRIIDGALLLAEESGWQLPAHNTYIRDTPVLPLPDPKRPVVDLFAAETGAQLAALLYLFEDRMNAVTPMIAERLDDEIHHRIITPYLTEHFWWMGNGDEPMNNWTAWCTQNVLLTVFLRPFDAKTRRAVVEKAAGSLDCFLKDYGEDGACEEGVLYYRHAGLCLFNALNILADVAPDAFAPLWKEDKIRNIAEFIPYMHVAGDRYFNFADSSARAGFCGAREYLFGKAVGSDLLADFAAADWRADPAPDQPDEINLFYRLQGAMSAAELASQGRPRPVPDDHFFPSIGLMVARDGQYALAVKAGDNGDSHNHNDTGSFTLYRNGKPFVVDVGVESYTAKTFSARRYEIWTMQSAWHNLPTFGGVMQKDGATFAASDVAVALTPEAASISMELAGAYPAEAEVETYRRAVVFIKGKGIEITDSFSGKKPATLSLMFAEMPALEPDRIVVEGTGAIAIDGAGPLTMEAAPIADPRLRAAWPDTLYRVLIPLGGDTLRLTIN